MGSHELTAKIPKLRQPQSLIEEVQQEAEAIRAAVKAVVGDTGEIRVGEYRVTWGAIKSARIDTTALKKSTPDISEAFTRETTTRRFCVA